MTKEDIIKIHYSFYDENLATRDIELDGAQVQQLMQEYADIMIKESKINKGVVCGTCEKEVQLYNVVYKKWYCINCKKYFIWLG